MSTIRILVADDDRSIAGLIKRVLSEDGYAIDVAHSGEEARLLCFVNRYDGIVLDLDLGDRHGFEVLQELRSDGKTSPVLLYTGNEDVAAIVRGLDAGADEYVVKPVTNAELRARVRSLIRRGPSGRVSEELRVGAIRLNRLTRRATVGNTEIDLTPMELRLLEHLMLNAGRIVTRGELHDKVWDMHFDPSSNLVDAHVARLRKKIHATDSRASLVTRRGIGFVLDSRDVDDCSNSDHAYGLSNAQV